VTTLPVLNTQAPEKEVSDPERVASGLLEVHSIFDTFQGEGPFAGTPAVFVRLSGCNLSCPSCDTEYTFSRNLMTPGEVLHQVGQYRPRTLVVITGGEPFRQPIWRLCNLLQADGYLVQVETNGTIYPDKWWRLLDRRNLHVVCSPKTGEVNRLLMVNSWKLVIDSGHVLPNGKPSSTLGQKCPVFNCPEAPPDRVWVQPLDEKNPQKNHANLNAAIECCKRFGYNLSLQLHKQLGME
jgi:7-carboxy-7-deazaguanine synthase